MVEYWKCSQLFDGGIQIFSRKSDTQTTVNGGIDYACIKTETRKLYVKPCKLFKCSRIFFCAFLYKQCIA